VKTKSNDAEEKDFYQELKKIKGYENCTKKQAENIMLAMDTFLEIAFDLHQQKPNLFNHETGTI
jgi:hemerythrin superfamily protein